MGALPSTKIQVNYNVGRTLINVYADDEMELQQLLSGLSQSAGAISEAEKLLGAVSTVASTLGGVAVTSTAQPFVQPQQAAQGPAQGVLPPGVDPMFCEHGQMTFKEGVSQAGNQYQIFHCPIKVCDSKWPPRKRR